MNFYPFHIGDYISHTSHLSDEEDLAYRRMIDLYYLTEKPFDDISLLCRRVKAELAIVENLLHEFFIFEDDDCWHSKRADIEIAKYQYLKESGKKGAEIRWGNREEKPTQSIPNSPPNATPLATKTITNTNTITNNKDIPIPEGMNIVVWKDYLKLRKTQKKPLTETALKGLQREADKADMTLVKALEVCCERGWIGFKADWIKDKQLGNQQNKMSNFWAQIEGAK